MSSRLPEPFEVRSEIDVDAYRGLIATTGWNELDGHDAKSIETALARSWTVVSVCHGDGVVAMGRAISDGAVYALLVDIVVDPSHRGLGLGGHVLDVLLERCAAAGISDILLFAALGTETFYERRGFVRRPNDAPGMIYRP